MRVEMKPTGVSVSSIGKFAYALARPSRHVGLVDSKIALGVSFTVLCRKSFLQGSKGLWLVVSVRSELYW